MTRSLSILLAFHSSFKTSDDALPSGRRINLQGNVINEVVEGRHECDAVGVLTLC